MDDEKPFKCPKCAQCFATSDHLVVHQRMHAKESRELLVKMPSSSSEHVSDQTPTPTRFLKTADVDGSVLFEEINPFDHDFKLASKRHASPAPAEQSTSAISSTVEERGKTKRESPPQQICETSSTSNDMQSDDESEVSSSTVESNLRELELKLKEPSSLANIDHNQISSSTTEDNIVSPVSLKCTEWSSQPSIIIRTPSVTVSSSNSTLTVASSATATQNPVQIFSSASTSTSSTEQNRNTQTQTSLQSLLQQIQKQTNPADGSAKPTSVSNSGTQSQEALREQLKSLIKSGQIKIKFTSDPSSPKVQATIVGSIAKKTVAPRTTAMTNTQPNPIKIEQSLSQMSQLSQKEVVIVKDKLTQENLPQKLLIPQQTSTQMEVVQNQQSPKIQLPQKLVAKPLNTIQIKPKPVVTKPILIAPKELSCTSDSSKSITASPMSVLCTSASIVSSVPTNPASRLELTKQKLKHVIQQNASNGTENALLNGHATMLSNVNPQGKYKHIVLDTDLTTIECIKQGRKQKGRVVIDDCSPEEKRQKFLERNRAAAARCRQKRKIWVNQLESKSDDLLQTNNLLMNEINALRSEVAQLKALLLAHKDCPVTLQQKALLGQMTPGSYVAAVSDGQIIAIHQVPNGNTQQASSAEEVATSALTDMAARATVELGIPASQSAVTVQSTEGGLCTASSTTLLS